MHISKGHGDPLRRELKDFIDAQVFDKVVIAGNFNAD